MLYMYNSGCFYLNIRVYLHNLCFSIHKWRKWHLLSNSWTSKTFFEYDRLWCDKVAISLSPYWPDFGGNFDGEPIGVQNFLMRNSLWDSQFQKARDSTYSISLSLKKYGPWIYHSFPILSFISLCNSSQLAH